MARSSEFASRRSPSQHSTWNPASASKLLPGRTRTRTDCPVLTSCRVTWLPTKPAAPVTSVVIECGKPHPGTGSMALQVSRASRNHYHFRGRWNVHCRWHDRFAWPEVLSRSARRSVPPSFPIPSKGGFSMSRPVSYFRRERQRLRNRREPCNLRNEDRGRGHTFPTECYR